MVGTGEGFKFLNSFEAERDPKLRANLGGHSVKVGEIYYGQPRLGSLKRAVKRLERIDYSKNGNQRRGHRF